jgi:DNA-directed RNA polymerase specialized sigma subunit
MEKHTLEQIGLEMGITKMAVCHIVKKVVNKLRNMEE